MQPPSESTVEADFNVRAASHWTQEHSRWTWRAAHLLHVPPDTFWACFIAAAPLSSDVAGTTAFSLLVLSQRHVSRQGISDGRHVTIVKEERKRPVEAGSRYGVAGASDKGDVSREVDEEVRFQGQDATRGATA
ncbi:hypothetical protein GJ744_004999 [Endocarpon pusillum]|uniref:Uncharacterized protein n=1 Tax=Endocarpon pusillum TaxID=364733 RepID=A0A8H7A7K1_9EURO|nr:hypothetical protein GJ744_004999 [Endocarpon pusillum]